MVGKEGHDGDDGWSATHASRHQPHPLCASIGRYYYYPDFNLLSSF